jgi:cyclin G-associated kinase
MGNQSMPGYMQPQRKHVKVLLCTLHTILWDGNTWQVIGMDKMNDPNQVKKYYRKAILMCHPDKIAGNDVNPDKVYIANRCYSALNDAFNEYKNEPGINL